MGGKTYLVFDNRGEDIVNSDPNLITLANTYKFNVGKTDAENTVTWSMAYAAINRVNISWMSWKVLKLLLEKSMSSIKRRQSLCVHLLITIE